MIRFFERHKRLDAIIKECNSLDCNSPDYSEKMRALRLKVDAEKQDAETFKQRLKIIDRVFVLIISVAVLVVLK